jgi:hypothetical protein
MQDRPTYNEILEAVQQFLENEVVPALDGPKKFHARVAANLLAIVRRELQTEPAQLTGEWNDVNALLGVAEPMPPDRDELLSRLRERTTELCKRIRRGEADSGAWRPAVLDHVRQTVTAKLEVANPKYLGLLPRSAETEDHTV